VSPQSPDCSPVAGNSIPRLTVYVLGIFNSSSCYLCPIGTLVRHYPRPRRRLIRNNVSITRALAGNNPLVNKHLPNSACRRYPCYGNIHAILIIALLTSKVGKTTVKSPEDADLSAPKSNTNTEGFVKEIEVVFGVVL